MRKAVARSSHASNRQADRQAGKPAAKVLSPGPPEEAHDQRLLHGQMLVRTALAYRGMAYRWGGRSPQTGFDCSGLVQTVCARWGIYLPRIARTQFKQGVPVRREFLEPGDLVFFKNTYRRGLSHVGIYVGDGWFLHAAGRGKGVVLSLLDRGYHRRHWAGARRLDLSSLPAVPGESLPDGHITLEASPEETPAKAQTSEKTEG